MADKGPDTLKIEYRLDQGVPGRDDDPKNPISRALTSLMKDNSRLPSLAQTFLVDEAPGEPWRWLGVFVKSAGDRILFFPGFKPTMTVCAVQEVKFSCSTGSSSSITCRLRRTAVLGTSPLYGRRIIKAGHRLLIWVLVVSSGSG